MVKDIDQGGAGWCWSLCFGSVQWTGLGAAAYLIFTLPSQWPDDLIRQASSSGDLHPWPTLRPPLSSLSWSCLVWSLDIGLWLSAEMGPSIQQGHPSLRWWCNWEQAIIPHNPILELYHGIKGDPEASWLSLSLSFSLSLYVISVASGSTVVAFYFKMASQALNQSLLTCLL